MSAPVFHCFPLLPVEVRCMVWRECLPRRIVEIDVPSPLSIDTYCELWTTSVVNARPPRISGVCRESRRIVSKHGRYLFKHMDTVLGHNSSRQVVLRFGSYMYNLFKAVLDDDSTGMTDRLRDLWVCPETDVVHMHSDDGYDPDRFPAWDKMEFFTNLRHAAAMVQGASILHDLVYHFHQPSSPLRYCEHYEHLQGLDEYAVVLRTINVHLTEEQASKTNLFGLLGEEVVKCVDAYNIRESGFAALRDLSPEHDVEAREAFELLDLPGFHAFVRQWEGRVAKEWLFSKWLRAIDPDNRPQMTALNLEYPTDMTAQREDIGTVWASTLASDAGSVLGGDAARHPDNYTVVEGNAWVYEVSRTRPRFRPVVMFRLCVDECWRRPRRAAAPPPGYEYSVDEAGDTSGNPSPMSSPPSLLQ